MSGKTGNAAGDELSKEMRQLTDQLYLETTYPGVNVLALSTHKGLICIDTPTFARDARAWVTRVRKLHPYTIRFLVLSDPHGDRILNSRWFNAPIIVQRQTEQQLRQYETRYPSAFFNNLLAHNPVYNQELLNGPVVQPALSFGEQLTLGNDHQRVELWHMPGPATGTIWAHFPPAGILFTGDSVVNGEPPSLVQADCTAWLASLDALLRDPRFQDVHTIVPGRGDICDRQAVDAMIAYLDKMQECVRDHAQSGRPREELRTMVPELATCFPHQRWPQNWTDQQILSGLEHLYDQIQLVESAGAT